MPKFRHKPNIVEAHRTMYGGQMDTPQGLLTWDADDWIIHGVGDVHYSIKHDVFIESYEAFDKEAGLYLEKVTRR